MARIVRMDGAEMNGAIDTEVIRIYLSHFNRLFFETHAA